MHFIRHFQVHLFADRKLLSLLRKHGRHTRCTNDRVVFNQLFKEDHKEEGKSVASNFIWALAMVFIVGMLAAALYYRGIFSGTKKHEIDVEVKVPGVTNN